MLGRIAQDMTAQAVRSGGMARRELSRGLVLELWGEAPGRWVLRISRPVKMPSAQEVAIVRRAFGVPADVEAQESNGCEVWMRWRPVYAEGGDGPAAD